MRDFVPSTTLLLWWLAQAISVALMAHSYSRIGSDRDGPLHPSVVCSALSSIALGALPWLSMSSLTIQGGDYAYCAMIVAFCAGSLINLTPQATLVRASIAPVLLLAITAMVITGRFVPALCLAGFGSFVAFEPITRSRLFVNELVEMRLRAEYDSTHDSLTGLLNRAGIESAAVDGELALYLDVDQFKSVNDSFGHGIGDDVLVETASRLDVMCRQHESTVGRLGGDEFVVLTHSTEPEVADALAHDIVMAMAAPFEAGMPINVSVGIAPLRISNSLSGQLRDADLALYAAKKTGEKVRWCSNNT